VTLPVAIGVGSGPVFSTRSIICSSARLSYDSALSETESFIESGDMPLCGFSPCSVTESVQFMVSCGTAKSVIRFWMLLREAGAMLCGLYEISV
jgi:hypothetical protein